MNQHLHCVVCTSTTLYHISLGELFRALTFRTPSLLVGHRWLGWDSYFLPKQVIARHSTIICRELYPPNESETGYMYNFII